MRTHYRTLHGTVALCGVVNPRFSSPVKEIVTCPECLRKLGKIREAQCHAASATCSVSS